MLIALIRFLQFGLQYQQWIRKLLLLAFGGCSSECVRSPTFASLITCNMKGSLSFPYRRNLIKEAMNYGICSLLLR